MFRRASIRISLVKRVTQVGTSSPSSSSVIGCFAWRRDQNSWDYCCLYHTHLRLPKNTEFLHLENQWSLAAHFPYTKPYMHCEQINKSEIWIWKSVDGFDKCSVYSAKNKKKWFSFRSLCVAHTKSDEQSLRSLHCCYICVVRVKAPYKCKKKVLLYAYINIFTRKSVMCTGYAAYLCSNRCKNICTQLYCRSLSWIQEKLNATLA